MYIFQSYIDLLLIVFAFILSGLLVGFTIPHLIKIAYENHLFDKVGERKVHKKAIPFIGGVAIFIGVVITTMIATNGYSFDILKYIFSAILIMFFVGLKDDIAALSPKYKFAFQILAALILFFLADVRITNFQGVFGLYEVNYWLSLFSTTFLIVLIINAFNFIDGLDGLASGMAFIGSAFFGYWFFISGHIQYSILCFALSGSLITFFYYNVFGKANKLFMGDSGSLIIGVILSVATIKFIEFNSIQNGLHIFYSSPAIAFSVILIPLIDLLRVFIIRIIFGRSPFKPDNNHFHHYLFQLNNNHLYTTIVAMALNISFIALALYLSLIKTNVNVMLVILSLLGYLFVSIPYILVPEGAKIVQKQMHRTLRRIINLFV
jgi:UDP-N-acetylmuramyl pentapeptide phosphotransferase/UDP-N-acetylglucosamine-1-phosphate transferase